MNLKRVANRVQTDLPVGLGKYKKNLFSVSRFQEGHKGVKKFPHQSKESKQETTVQLR